MSALLCRNMILPFCIQTTSGDEFALIRSVVGTDGDEDKAGMHERARRLMACWNATADIPAEALEAGVVAKLVEAATIAAEELQYFVEFARRQCEFEGDSDAGQLAADNLRAALALAKGEAA